MGNSATVDAVKSSIYEHWSTLIAYDWLALG